MAMDISNFATGLRKFGLGGGKQSKGLSEEELKKAFGSKKSATKDDAGKTDLSPVQPQEMNEAPAMKNLMPSVQDKVDEEELKNKRRSFYA